MTALKTAQTRYSTKQYNTEKQIPKEKIEALKEILRLSPSAINIQPWKFTFIENEQIKEQLSAVSMYNDTKIKQAPLLVVFSVVDDLDAFQNVVEQFLPGDVLQMYNQGKASLSEEELKNWLTRQVYIALGFGLSACSQLGLDATPMEGIEKDKYAAILKMEGHQPVVAMSVGYACQDDYNRLEVAPKTRRDHKEIIDSII